MWPALVKVLGGEFHEGELKLTLVVVFVRGKPQVGDGLFSPEGYLGDYFYEIENISHTTSTGIYKLTLDYHEPRWVWEKRWKAFIENGADNVLSGITVENYRRLTTTQKMAYVFSVVDLICMGKLNKFIKAQIEPSVKWLLKGRERSEGLTKFGGMPLASKDFEFPKDENGRSAFFIGQIHLSEFTHLDTLKQFNGKGILYLFGTIISDEKHHKFDRLLARYSEQTEDLAFVELPSDLLQYGVFREMDIIVSEELDVSTDEERLWTGKEMTELEQHNYFEISNLFRFYNTGFDATLLRPAKQLPGDVFFQLYTKDRGQIDATAPDADGKTEEQRWLELYKKAMEESVNWKHLFDFETDSSYFKQVSNFDGNFNLYETTWILMIKKTDFINKSFEAAVTVRHEL